MESPGLTIVIAVRVERDLLWDSCGMDREWIGEDWKGMYQERRQGILGCWRWLETVILPNTYTVARTFTRREVGA